MFSTYFGGNRRWVPLIKVEIIIITKILNFTPKEYIPTIRPFCAYHKGWRTAQAQCTEGN